MSGIIGHTLYAELALREAVQQKHRWAGVMQAHRASFHAGAYIGSDIQVMPEADRAVMSVVPQLLEKMATRMCQHYGCSPEEQREVLEGMRQGAGMAPPSTARSK